MLNLCSDVAAFRADMEDRCKGRGESYEHLRKTRKVGLAKAQELVGAGGETAMEEADWMMTLEKLEKAFMDRPEAAKGVKNVLGRDVFKAVLSAVKKRNQANWDIIAAATVDGRVVSEVTLYKTADFFDKMVFSEKL